MDARRWTSAIALGAVLLAQTAPAQAGRMLCGMKKDPARTEACSRCDGPAPSASSGVLRARSCCRVVPSEATGPSPVVLSAVSSARKAFPGHLSAFDPTPVPALALTLGADLCGAAQPALSRQLPSESPTRTVVLRN